MAIGADLEGGPITYVLKELMTKFNARMRNGKSSEAIEAIHRAYYKLKSENKENQKLEFLVLSAKKKYIEYLIDEYLYSDAYNASLAPFAVMSENPEIKSLGSLARHKLWEPVIARAQADFHIIGMAHILGPFSQVFYAPRDT